LTMFALSHDCERTSTVLDRVTFENTCRVVFVRVCRKGS
jgi:hypothetical protein